MRGKAREQGYWGPGCVGQGGGWPFWADRCASSGHHPCVPSLPACSLPPPPVIHVNVKLQDQ